MSCKLIITKPAEKDLDGIIEYITQDLSAPKAASDLIYKIEKCYHNLEKNPLMYAECQNERLRAKKYRKVVINNYLIIYKYDEKNDTVYILRFIYGRRDYINLI